ncbi:unnamed protein product [Cyclocybe aegerita]|uniref:Nuclear condensin complex subunit 3 C-terminal domain-containing protein n=1 Tax=Cyclocybe aegerita TaxID=1973307 RepID=A0A8S0WU40_CYCAE|nr:unnamed protein product [Cyclocybe aegerita]
MSIIKHVLTRRVWLINDERKVRILIPSTDSKIMAPASSSKQKSKEEVVEELRESIGAIFEQAQLSVANHKKNCVALSKIHTKAAAITHGAKGGGVKPTGERAFQEVFIDMVNRVLVVKKGVANADRVVKYVGSFVKFMNEKAIEAKAKTASSSSISAGNGDEDEETPTSRFVAKLLNWLIQGFGAKNKIVRYRCIQVVSEMISHLGEIDEDTYTELRDALTDRMNDKESLIRAQSVMALSKLVGSEEPDEIEQGEQTILQTLLEAVSADPAGEVRRAALLNVPLIPSTIDGILSRTRDVDAITRKLIYSNVLLPKMKHPRQLTIAHREQIVKDGLGDREPTVRVAAGKLVTSWFDTILAEEEHESTKGWEGDDGGVMKGLIRFLGLFDAVGPGEAVAVDAILSVFTTRPEVPDVFVFPDEYWKDLTAESVLLARVFVEHAVSSKNEARLETASLPVVTAFAFHVQEAYNSILQVLQEQEAAKLLRAGRDAREDEEEQDEELEEELAKCEVVMGELLKLALKLDYGDEIGRRKVFSVVKDMLAHPRLPPGLIERCLDVLKEIMPSERDLIRLIVEIVVELREGDEEAEVADELPIDDNQSDVSQTTIRRDKPSRKQKAPEDLSPEQRMEADVTDVRCLMLCIAMLERVNGTFEDNSTLEGILGDLIIPSVKRKELAMREKALVSLGLCCLIAKSMALNSFQLFLSQAQNAPPELKVQVLRIIMDLLIMYDHEFFARSEETAKQIVDFLLQLLEGEESPEAQAVLATGFCKLLLSGIVNEPKVLVCLALLYISPTTANNQELRQCLSYFFPVYSYSSAANQCRIASIFMSTFDLAVRLHEDLDDDQEMITPHQLGLLMVDWTNPLKAAEVAVDKTPSQAHISLAVEILVALYDSDRTVDEQKILCQLLGQLHIEAGLELRSIHKLNILISHHEEQCPFENSANEKLFGRFKTKFSTLFEKELKEIDPQEYLDDEFRDVYQKMGVDVPEEGEDGQVRRRSRSKAKSKGKRKAWSDDEEDEEDEEEEKGEAAEEDEEMQQEEQAEEQPTEEEHGSAADAQSNIEEDNSDAEVDPEEEVTEVESRENSPTPPPTKPKKKPPATRQSGRNPKVATTKSRKGAKQQDSESQGSNEENVPPPVIVSVTPKKKGVKRVHTPGSGNANSPANRKRTRVKAPLKPVPKEATPEESDIESPPSPTPKKNTRQTRARAANARKKTAKELLPPATQSDEEADEVASLMASSDDFGGYSD